MPSRGEVKRVRIHWDSSQCIGCLSCVVVCSERHTGMSAPSRARLQVIVDPLGGDLAATWCRQCQNATCAEACPEEAISLDEQVHAWLVDDALCIGCGACVEACSFGAILMDPFTGTAIKCDLCMGTPRCVEVCPAHALGVRAQEEIL